MITINKRRWYILPKDVVTEKVFTNNYKLIPNLYRIKPCNMGKFVIKAGVNNQFYFSLKADNGQKILASEGYTSRSSCFVGIESVRANALDNTKYERKLSNNLKYYFNLKAGNGQVIGTSEMYDSEAGRDNGIASVKANAPSATVVEE